MLISWVFFLVLAYAGYHYLILKPKSRLEKASNPKQYGLWKLTQIQRILKHAPMPIIHEECLKQNAANIISTASNNSKYLRIATKSIRIPEIIKMIASMDPTKIKLMCYSVKEAEFLVDWAKQSNFKFQDILIAYPTVNESDIMRAYRLNQEGVDLCLMIDHIGHVEQISKLIQKKFQENPAQRPLRLCIDFDCSIRIFDMIHIGAHRSPCHTMQQFQELVVEIMRNPALRFSGIMTYEAQIAGVGDRSYHNTSIYNTVLRLMKWYSSRHVQNIRRSIWSFLQSQSIEYDFFNGGGSGNIEMAAKDPHLTEVTAGSGFLQPKLFDHYLDNFCEPALAVALQITRIPHRTDSKCDIICCQSGGFVSSGPPGPDKSPEIFLPRGLSTFPDEAFGEVQTPMKVSKELYNSENCPRIGDFVLIRPAKSGEIAERFPKCLVINSNTSETNPPQIVSTYRGFNKAFY